MRVGPFDWQCDWQWQSHKTVKIKFTLSSFEVINRFSPFTRKLGENLNGHWHCRPPTHHHPPPPTTTSSTVWIQRRWGR